MKYMFAIGCLYMLWSGLLQASGSGLSYTKNPEIEPGKSYEACLWLSTGDGVHYEFTSSANLRFNIHYHENDEVRYPVPVKLTSKEDAVFESESEHQYCLMWNNPLKERVKLYLHYQHQPMNATN